jgi:hypothetical protein
VVTGADGSQTITWQQNSGPLNNATGTVDTNGNASQVIYGDPANPYSPTQYTNRNNQSVTAIYDQYGNTAEFVNINETLVLGLRCVSYSA